jgi:hypothetical protein
MHDEVTHSPPQSDVDLILALEHFISLLIMDETQLDLLIEFIFLDASR